jgi:hypothetical protein
LIFVTRSTKLIKNHMCLAIRYLHNKSKQKLSLVNASVDIILKIIFADVRSTTCVYLTNS